MGIPVRKIQDQSSRQPSVKTSARGSYQRIRSINGDHPFKDRVAGGFVEYQARQRKNGKVTYFNFNLAKEMGLLNKDHPEVMTRELEKVLLDTFAIIIINEYDITRGARFPQEDVKPGRYMATRYLQLQHPGRNGMTSGDGRSIWNGYTTDRKGRMWDITSCGTGATCLSPATALNGRFYKSGDPSVSYGCGYSSISEGVIDLLMSEIFSANGINTERVLGMIEFPGNFAIKIRAGLNLLRPSHFFNHLRQNQFQRLKSAVDLFMERQIRNKSWAPTPRGMNPYQYLLQQEARTFARIAAQFESEYIFCWLDWDGDNILADGGIIDFGSIRQFGLYHHEYRFDDVQRWSTNIKEQKRKARGIVQTFAQMTDYLITGKKKPLEDFRKHAALKEFDRLFIEAKREFLLRKIGFTAEQTKNLMKGHTNLVRRFEAFYYKLEAAKTSRGPTKVPDGITTNAVYSMRDLLRMLPAHFAQHEHPMTERELLNIIKSKYADRKAGQLSTYLSFKLRRVQRHYHDLVAAVAKEARMPTQKLFAHIAEKSAVINRYERITGDAICTISEAFVRQRRQYSVDQFSQLLHHFIGAQNLNPETRRSQTSDPKNQKARTLLQNLFKVVKDYREGL